MGNRHSKVVDKEKARQQKKAEIEEAKIERAERKKEEAAERKKEEAAEREEERKALIKSTYDLEKARLEAKEPFKEIDRKYRTKEIKKGVKDSRLDQSVAQEHKVSQKYMDFGLGMVNTSTGFLFKMIPSPLAVVKVMMDSMKMFFVVLVSGFGALKYSVEKFRDFARWFYV